MMVVLVLPGSPLDLRSSCLHTVGVHVTFVQPIGPACDGSSCTTNGCRSVKEQYRRCDVGDSCLKGYENSDIQGQSPGHKVDKHVPNAEVQFRSVFSSGTDS